MGGKKAQIRVAVHRGNASGADSPSNGPIGNVGNIDHAFSKARLSYESSEVGGCFAFSYTLYFSLPSISLM